MVLPPTLHQHCTLALKSLDSFFLSNSGKLSFTPHPGFPTVDLLTSSRSWACTRKDIPDLDGRHGDGGHGLAEAAAVHHHHEQVAAWDLLDDKGPGGTRGTDMVGSFTFPPARSHEENFFRGVTTIF